MANPPWTYSQLDSFENCPKKFYHLKVARDVVEPPTVHTEWGTRVHTALEDYVKDGTPLPEGMTQWDGIAAKLKALPGEKHTEIQFAIDANFQPCAWKGSWSRGIADLLVIYKDKALVADYKTGKRKPTEQLDLYANYVFHHYPEVNTVTTGFIWLKEKKVDWNSGRPGKQPITRGEVPFVWAEFLPRVRKLESAYERDKWPAKTSGLCKAWCPVLSCEFNGKRK
jgi:hypothetical protein